LINPTTAPIICQGGLILVLGIFIYLFIYFSTDIDNTSNTNKNNKMPAKDKKAPEGTLTSTLINTI